MRNSVRPQRFAPLLLALAALGCGDRVSADTRGAQVDALFAQWNKTDSPGCSVAVMQGGEIVYRRAYGMADLDHGIANTPATVFHIASISKQFAAAAVVLLAQEGKLSLDDQARKYVPELPDFGTSITIRHLVHHTSGLRDQWDLLGLSGWRYSQDLITDNDVMSLVRRQKRLDFQPGERYSYSNTGYTLLAQIVRRVSGKSFREFTSERLFRPLGMNATHFRDDHAEIVPNIAYGYLRSGDTFKLSVTNFDTVGATSLLTTVEDLAKWEENFYDGKVGGPALLRQMVERGVLNDGTQIDYAFGLTVENYRGLTTVGHSGSDAGYRAYLLRFPDQHFSVACLCNAGDVRPVRLGEQIADIYLADRMRPRADRELMAASSANQLDRELGTYQPTARQFAQYAGTYLSEEIDLPYRVAVEKGALVVRAVKIPDGIVLKPLNRDSFDGGDLGTVRFTRDSGGRVASMFVNPGSIVDFKFSKRDR